ncbi:MAG: hypothetical protein M3N59_02805 [bacterium]|nr:hypothetical protein [bacterium]
MAIERASEYSSPEPERRPEERFLPTARSLDDFPKGTEVIVYAMRHGQYELGWGTVEEHSEYGIVVVRPRSKSRGIPVHRSSQEPDPTGKELVKFRPGSPGLIREEDLLALREEPDRIAAWAAAGGFYKPSEAARLAAKIPGFTGYEGRPWASQPTPGVRDRPKGIRRLPWDR